jgi:hypothetical protein
MLKDVPREAVDVVVRTPERFVRPHDHAADRADPPRRIIDIVNDRKRTLFVGNGEVAAGEPQRRKRAQRWLQPFRRNRKRKVCAGEPVLLEKVIVEGR